MQETIAATNSWNTLPRPTSTRTPTSTSLRTISTPSQKKYRGLMSTDSPAVARASSKQSQRGIIHYTTHSTIC
jgi:hypothetical protein